MKNGRPRIYDFPLPDHAADPKAYGREWLRQRRQSVRRHQSHGGLSVTDRPKWMKEWRAKEARRVAIRQAVNSVDTLRWRPAGFICKEIYWAV